MIEQLIQSAFTENGLIAVMFLLLFVFFLRYIPKVVDKHFEAINVLQQQFSKDLERITDHNKQTNERILGKFIDRLGEISQEHEKQNAFLDNILNKTNETHDEVKAIKIHITNNNHI